MVDQVRVTPTELPMFGNLPTEIRLVIWKEAVMADHRDRIVPLTQDKRVVFASKELLNPSGVFRANVESREVALKVYDQALPVVPFFGQPQLCTPADYHPTPVYPGIEEEGRALDATHEDAVFRASFELDIFLITARTGHCQINKSPIATWPDIHAELPSTVRPPPGPDALPRNMTWVLTPEMRAQIVRLMEIRVMGGPFHAPSEGIHHNFDSSEFPNARECHHKESVLGGGIGTNTRRILVHLSQGYTSAELHPWLGCDVCPLQ
ncbi:hypothetical protein PG984_011881 [Apiospora sp. TS-2023a]